MVERDYTGSFLVTQLIGEIAAADDGLLVDGGTAFYLTHGEPGADDTVTQITVHLPDDATAATVKTVAAVVKAHKPQPAAPSQAEKVGQALATIENDATLADSVKTALREIVQALVPPPSP